MFLVLVYPMLLAAQAAEALGPAFTDVTDPAVFVQYRAMESSGSALALNRHPAPAWADWDGDGDLDLPGYRNDARIFVDVSESSGLLARGHYRVLIWRGKLAYPMSPLTQR